MRKNLLLLACAALLMPMSLSAQAEAQTDPWSQADEIVNNIKKVSFPERQVSIVDFGAVANNPQALAHDAINLAILAMNQQGGGTVVVPADTFYTGPITMKSNVRLHFQDGAVLKFTTEPEYYFPAVSTRWEGVDCNNTHPLIYAYGETNIALTGKAVLDAQGAPDRWWNIQARERKSTPEKLAPRLQLLRWGEEQLPLHQRTFTLDNYMRPQFVNFYRCNTVLIEDLTLLNSPFWVIHPLFCDDLIVRGVTVRNHGPNGDGCDPESCKNVLIEDCVFDTGDDCIAIKSGRNADGRKWNVPSENIVVRRCHMADGHGGIVIGSEISGGYRNLFVEDCTMDSPNLDRVVRIKTSNCRGGIIENIYVRNIEVGECREAVVRINLAYEPKENCNRAFDPIVRNVYLENINCQKSQYGIYLHGLDNVTNIDNINLKDCNFNGVTSKGNFMAGLVGSVSLDNVKINGKKLKELKAQKASKK